MLSALLFGGQDQGVEADPHCRAVYQDVHKAQAISSAPSFCIVFRDLRPPACGPLLPPQTLVSGSECVTRLVSVPKQALVDTVSITSGPYFCPL